jgi:hypothetical protein
VDLPDRGACVRLELDTKGFIRTVQVLDAAPPAHSSNRDNTITRLSVLKTAAAFLAQMGQVHESVKSDHVIPSPSAGWPGWRRRKTDCCMQHARERASLAACRRIHTPGVTGAKVA